MGKVIIGIDPDTKAHGVAIYINGKLTTLKSMPLMELYEFLTIGMSVKVEPKNITVHMENVKGNNAVFMSPGRMDKKREGEAKARGRTLGMCQQSQAELERMFDYLGVEVVLHPISKRWKKEKAEFEKVTGWTGRSNEDTRSASYFGMIGLN